jgi:GNAT superfamily N-acetyltransferase
MIRGKFLTSADDTRAVMDVRARVCQAEGLPGGGADDRDTMAVYALVFDEQDVPSGSGRLYLDDDRFTLGCVGVLPHRRGLGLGDLILRMLLYRAQELGAPEVFVEAAPQHQAFYAQYGFQPDEEQSGRMRVKADQIDPGGCHGSKHGCGAHKTP